MAGLCRLLTAATLVVHLTVGCCWHHAHACEGRGHLPPVQGAAMPDGQCPDSSGSRADHTHHGPQDCQGGTCSVVPSSRTVSDWFGQPSLAFVVPLLYDLSTSAGIFSEQRFFPTGRLLLAVRLHLANQVLLI